MKGFSLIKSINDGWLNNLNSNLMYKYESVEMISYEDKIDYYPQPYATICNIEKFPKIETFEL